MGGKQQGKEVGELRLGSSCRRRQARACVRVVPPPGSERTLYPPSYRVGQAHTTAILSLAAKSSVGKAGASVTDLQLGNALL
jgi:hypothetical protein